MIRRRRVPAVLLAAALATAAALPVTPVDASPAASRGSSAATSVQLTVAEMSPSVPVPSSAARPLLVRLALRNLTGSALTGIRVLAIRGYPIGSQPELDRSLRQPASRPLDDSGAAVAVPATRPIRVSVPAAGTVSVLFRTTTSLSTDAGLCLCANAVYPLYFTAQSTDGTVLGSTRGYLPSFDAAHRTARVSWVWPLIDRPHRLLGRRDFIGSDLTGLIAGGRLDSALEVLEDVGPSVPVTVVLDPELLDELETMAGGRYAILSENGTKVRGTGAAAARDWLARLAAVLSNDDVSVDLTPYADPDVQSLSRHNQSWNAGMPQDMRANVRAALAGRAVSRDVAWPPSGALGPNALDSLAASGTRTVLLRGASVRPSSAHNVPVSVTRLRTAHGTVRAALTSSALERAVSDAVTLGASGLSALPTVLAELAVRVDQSPAPVPAAVLTPSRYVYPDPSVAARVIRDTSRSSFTAPVALRDLAGSNRVVTAGYSSPRRVPDNLEGLPADILSTLGQVRTTLPVVRSLLGQSPNAQVLLGSLTNSVQRTTSAAYRLVSGSVGGAAAGRFLARRLLRNVQQLAAGVRIVPSHSGSYTLASNHSSLPITVDNALGYVVAVRVKVTSVSGLPGLSSPRTKTLLVQPTSKQQLQVPTVLQRSGRIRVHAQLETPSGAPLGRAVTLSVHSTALGEVGIIITVVAGAVLVVALLMRYLRRIQRLRRKRAALAHPSQPERRTPVSGPR